MGYPSESELYRNQMKDVQRFFNTLHPDHYKVFNLCSERKYKHDRFNNNVSEYPFDDHNPPNLDTIGLFCKDVEDWLELDPENVAAIHCKAGKGRTGTMIACWLLYNKHCQTGSESMRVFATKRTHDSKGITIPSQMRYVRYFEALLQHGRPVQKVPDITKILSTIKMNALPNFNIGGGCTPYLGIVQQNKFVFYTKPLNLKKGTLEIEIYCGNILLSNDVKIQFFNKNSKGHMFSYCFHTAFIEGNTILIRKLEIDKAHKDNKHFPSNFSIELHFIDKETLDQEDVLINDQMNQTDLKSSSNTTTNAVPTTHYATGLAKLYGNNDQLLTTTTTATKDNDCDGGKKENDQDNQQQSTVQRKQSTRLFICPKCKLSINSSDVSVNDGNNNYHWKCLVCNNCQKSLANENDCLFQESGISETLCTSCGTKSGFFKTCHACNLVIKSSDFEEVGNLSYHTSCFYCTHCLLFLGDKDFTISDKKELKCSSCLHKPSIVQKEEIQEVEAEEDVKVEVEQLKVEIEEPKEEEEIEIENEIEDEIEIEIEKVDLTQLEINNQENNSCDIKCTKCKLEIGLRPLVLDIGIWHRECFVCQHCEIILDQKRYFLRDDVVLCSECDIKHILNKPVVVSNDGELVASSASMMAQSEIICNGCKLTIDDEEMMSALGSKWHLQCLHCCTCQQPITGLFGEHQGLIYCKDHFEEITGVRCEGCNQMIVGRYLKANGRQLHPHCFICFICTRVLQDGVFYEKAGEIICDRCRSTDIIKRRTQLQLQQSMIGGKRSLTASAVASSGSGSSACGTDSSSSLAPPHSNTLSRSLTTSQAHQTSLTGSISEGNSDEHHNQHSTISYVHNIRSSFRNSQRINLSDLKKNRTLHIYPSFHRQMKMNINNNNNNINNNNHNNNNSPSTSTFTQTSPKQFIVAYPSSKNHSKRREFLNHTSHSMNNNNSTGNDNNENIQEINKIE
ncbi:hypothetical protein CYY_007241 [Polysphondylium violaceum]|uniref:Phosphatidylinositol-3,4,5-trisphosphate 3-phosphatase n=1 Tax=Polysphondylium violaceum TaxID=133409 RepID=A0A8J4PS58_9MYCE|nr:hypothetical protein CYY_007241 [Polysphondylium violaceum]